MFLDRSKQTMITVEMTDGWSVEDFQRKQVELLPELRTLIEQLGLARRVRIDATRIAIDIEHPLANKGMGARRFVQFLQERSIEPKRFIAFGDSDSDCEMAAELHRLGLLVEFVFVGDPAEFVQRDNVLFPVSFTSGKYDAGTLEYLRALATPKTLAINQEEPFENLPADG
jgi:hypothetical protein